MNKDPWTTVAYRALPTADEMPPVYHEWLHWLPLYEDKPIHTVRAYGQGVRRVVSYMDVGPGGFGPDSLDQAGLTDTVRSMRSDPEVSRATLNQTLAALKSFFDFCIADRLVKQVPDIARIRKVARLDVPQVDPEYYRPDEIRELYTEASSQDNGQGRVRWASRDLAMC
ncbi:MAG: site-specific integrase, partial [Acidimicrobiaceae bacterium]|nr:site-specific integrase [Acidimicrobiaceae bacterium]